MGRGYNGGGRSAGGARLPYALLAVDIDWDRVRDEVLTHGSRILFIVIVAVVVTSVIQRVVSPVVRIAIREQMAGEPQSEVDKRIETLSHVIHRTLVVAITIAAVLTALPELGINVAPLIAGVGIVGLAIGFGAQNLVRDVINGLFILLENQYGKGDVVTIAGVSGLVEDINLRRTVLRDFDGAVHFIAHGQVQTSSNQTKGFSRVNLNVSVGYDADLEKAFAVIDRVGQEMASDASLGPKIREAPRAERVERLGDTTVDIRVTAVTEPMEQWSVMGELRRRLKTALDAEGVGPRPKT